MLEYEKDNSKNFKLFVAFVKYEEKYMDNEIITTQSITRNFVEISQEFVLDETPRTKTVFKAEMHPGGIRGHIIRYRKNASGACEEIIPVNFNVLHEDEGVKIDLPTDAVNKLYQKFDELSRLLREYGINYGEHNFAITDARALVITDQNKAEIIRRLLEENLGEEVWAQLAESNPDIATRLANAQLQTDRMVALQRFEALLEDEAAAESDWQEFFEQNTWIFGYGLRYQILRIIQPQPNYGGTNFTGTGGQRGDFLTVTEADARFTCLVEIKKPTTDLLQRTPYRNGVWGTSAELSGAVSQVQVNCAEWEIVGARTDQNRDALENIYTVSPKGIVVIGKTSQLDNRDKKNSFERFRREIRSPEIITFDELYERAKFIVDENRAPTEPEPEYYDDLPF